MVLWIIFAVMTAVTVIALLRPLNARATAPASRPQFEAAIYRDQLKALEADVAAGGLTPEEAQNARTEIARRLLAIAGEESANKEAAIEANPNEAHSSDDLSEANVNSNGRGASMAVIAFIPLMSLGLYSYYGSPDLPSAPASARVQPGIENQSIDQLIAKVEEHLAENPNDARGWEVLAPALRRLGRHQGAARAFRRVIEIEGPTAQRLSMLGETLMFANNGIISAEARKAFTSATAMDANLPDPRFYLGVASLQDGDKTAALATWRKILADSPEDAPWRGEVAAQIAKVEGIALPSVPLASGPLAQPSNQTAENAEAAPELSGPDASQVAAASQMSTEDRQAMIANMVAGLDERLTEDGGTFEEWLRLANAYKVLGQPEKRQDVITRARSALSEDKNALSQFEAALAQGGAS